MRVLTVTHFFSAHGGGIEIVAGHLCANWRRMGHSVIWAASDADQPTACNDYEALQLRSFNVVERMTGLPMPILTLSAMRGLWRQVQASDVVVIHDALYATSILAMLASRRAQKPVILIQHIAEIGFSSALLRSAVRLANAFIARPMLRAADRVVFISATTRDYFADLRTKAPPLLVFNGVDADIFHNLASVLPAVARAQFAIPLGVKLCMFAGRFVEKKGLAIIRELAELRPDLHFALAGRGPIEPSKWGLNNITVCRNLPQPVLAMLYRAADIFVLPSVGEGYPLVVQEAMACGLPVVCGEESAKADPGAGAWLVGVPVSLNQPAISAQRVSAAIDGLMVSPADRAAMSAYATRNYSWMTMARQVISLVQVRPGVVDGAEE